MRLILGKAISDEENFDQGTVLNKADFGKRLILTRKALSDEKDFDQRTVLNKGDFGKRLILTKKAISDEDDFDQGTVLNRGDLGKRLILTRKVLPDEGDFDDEFHGVLFPLHDLEEDDGQGAVEYSDSDGGEELDYQLPQHRLRAANVIVLTHVLKHQTQGSFSAMTSACPLTHKNAKHLSVSAGRCHRVH